MERRKNAIAILSGAAFLMALFLTSAAHALIMIGRGNAPVADSNWPLGTLEVANLKNRLGWWEGPPFGGGQQQFLYRGDVAAFQQALDLFGKIRAPGLRLVIHEGPQNNEFLKDPKNPNVDTRIDWTFTVWNPQSWHALYSNPLSTFASRDPNGGFRNPVDPPILDVYVAGADGKGLDWKAINVPLGITVIDERATSAGYAAADGSVIRGDVYDMLTSKPIAGAHITLSNYKENGGITKIAETDADAVGHFEVKKLPAGSYNVSAGAPGYVDRAFGYSVFSGNAIKNYTITLATPATVKGTVVDTTGKPLAGIKVRGDTTIAIDGRGYQATNSLEAQTDAQGAFEISNLPGGYFQLYVSDEHHHQLESLKIYSTTQSNISLVMTATGGVKGVVRSRDGSPAKSGAVSINPPGDLSLQVGKWGGNTIVQPDGTYQFNNVPPGAYVISTNPSMAILGRDPDAKSIEVKAGETLELELTGK